MPADNVFYTYIYYDPRTNQPFYVGKGKGKRGWKSKANTTFRARLRKLRQLNLEPVVRARMHLTETIAFMLEKLLIRVFGRKDLGLGPLFNHTWGGESGPAMFGNENPMRRPEVAAKLSAINKIRMNQPEEKAKMTGDNNPMRRLEVAAKQSASMKGVPKSADHIAKIKLNSSAAIRCSCVFCGKECNIPGLGHWHSNCHPIPIDPPQ